MSLFDRGFFIERVTATGIGLASAELEFRDGLNVIEGSSDTGKSYILGLIDFAFGASKRPRRIKAAKGYDRVVVDIQERKTKRRHQIERSLGGGKGIIVRTLRDDGGVESEQVLAAKHDPNDAKNLSTFLLQLAGFAPAMIRKNNKGEMQSLSFRNIAHLAIINETRMMSEWPPQHPRSKQAATAESEVFRLVLTGHTSPMPLPLPRKLSPTAAKGQVELLTQMEEQARNDLAQLGVQPEVAQAEVESVNTAHASLLGEYESARVELNARENERAALVRELRNVSSRVAVIEGLIARFELLDHHYEMDIARLQAIEETGSMLELMPATSCPVCGAAPNEHRPAEADEHFGIESVRTAAAQELEKTARLRADLHNAIADLRKELAEKRAIRASVNGEIETLQARIDEEVAPRARTSAGKLRAQSDRQRALLRARSLVEQLEDLAKRRVVAEAISKKKREKTSDDKEPTSPTTSEMDGFAQEVQQVLASWNYPELGRVVFSESQKDIVIDDQDRESHGKGVRALTCAAFITGILRHCVQKSLPHPGLIVLDSPLTAYKDPDPKPGSEDAKLRQAGVKEAFYRSLAGGLCPGQFIIIENQEPPDDVVPRIVYHHFSKSEVGRYGFFPHAKGVG
jgi:hypothetical protein